MTNKDNCNHEWGKAVYDPRIDSNGRKHDRWRKICKKCGTVDYTR